MPDFDKDLNPILANTDTSPLDLPNPATPVPHSYADLGGGRGAQGSALDGFFGNGPVVSNMLPTVSSKELYENRRYGTYSANIIDIEDQKAYAQSGWDKAANGILKGLNLAGTTVAGSFGMLYGAAKSPFTGRLADIWDNEVMQFLDNYNNEVDQYYLPNYYTNAEKNAAWYSPDNWFKTNWLFDKLIKNSGFAVGAMVSGNIANAGLLRAGAALGRAAAAGATAAESSQAFKLFTPLLKNTARAFSAGKNIEAAAVLEKEISSIADISARSSKLAEIAKQTNKFAGIGDTGRRTLIAAYSSAGESSFEALQTANQYRDGLIEDYKSKHGGLDPAGEDLDNINELAEKVGKTSFFGNMALLSVTEYVQLPKILGSSYSSSRQAANSLLGRTDDVLMKDGKYIAAPAATTKFGKVYDKITGIGRYVYDPKEAAQEVGQYALQVGTINYFNKAYQSKAADEWVDGFLYGFVGRGEDGEGVGAFVSKEGMESALMGGLTGGLMQAKGTFQETRATKNNTQKFLSDISSAPSFQKAFQDRMAAINRGVVLQQQQQDAVIQGDKLEAKDLDADMMHNYLAPRIKYGRFDMVMDDIAELRAQAMTNLASLKEQGMANINDTVDSYMARLSLFENTAKNMEELYKSLNLRYGGQVDEQGRRLYTDDVIDKMVYAATKVADYDLRIPQVGANLTSSGIVAQDAMKASIEGTAEEAKKAEEDVMKQIDELSSLNKDELKLDFFEVRELNARRKKFLDEYNAIKDKPAEYREAEAVPDQPVDEEVETTKIKVKTKAGDVDLEVGTEYFLGNIVKEDKDGNEVYGFPRITILGENEDGTIKIKDSNGKLHDITKAEIAKYKLGKVSSTLSNKKAKYYLDNVNNVFEFNFGKGNKVQGRLEYSPKEGILEFVYKNKKGEKKRIEVTGDQFVARDGFLEPMIKKIGELTAAEQQLTEQFAAEQDVRKVDKRAARLSVLNSLFEEISGNQKKVDNLLQQKKNELETITKELKTLEEKIASGDITKRNNFKKTTNNAIKAANRLSRMQEQLRLEIESLEAERNEAELTLEWISDLAQNIDELPTDSKEFLQELKDQRSALEDLILENGKSINALSDLVNRAEDALESAIDLLRRWVNQFEQAYPKVPTNLGQEWVDFIKANPNFLKLAPKYKEDLAMLEDMIAQIEDFTIKPTEEEIAELRKDLEKLQDSLKEAEQQLKIKNAVISKFEEVAKQYQAQKAEEERIQKNQALKEEILGSADPGLQTRTYSKEYEPQAKKTELAVVLSTKLSSKSEAPHAKRTNLFGVLFNKMSPSKKKKYKAVIVTSKNEADFKLGGLTQHLKDQSELPESEKEKIKPEKTIALVIVKQDTDGVYKPVDQDGNILEDVSVNNALYQVFPDPSLEWSEQYGGGSMFRKETPKERIDYYKEQYQKWVNETLDNPSSNVHSIEASFGTPQYVMNSDGTPNYDAVVSVVDAGLIDESNLEDDNVIYIPTTDNTVSRGSTTYDSPLGRPFLILNDAYVNLKNRLFNKKEAEAIYGAIYQLAVDINKNGNLKSETAKRYYNWLKSVVYWGKVRNAVGYNSIFFEDTEDGLMLYVSGKGKTYPFTPTAIRENKGELIDTLQMMYNNVNSTMVKKDDGSYSWKQPYEEILSVSEDGKVESKIWPNYQTYLLSSKGRKPEDVPLSTRIRPVRNVEGDVNRTGIYFTLSDTSDAKRYGNPPVKAVVTPKTLAPKVVPTPAASKSATPAAKPAAQEAPEGTVELDGKTINTYTSPKGKKIKFAATRAALKNPKALGIFPGGDLEAVLKELTDSGKTLDEAKEAIRNAVKQYVATKIKETEGEEELFVPGEEEEEETTLVVEEEAMQVPEEEELVVEEEAPVSDIEVKEYDKPWKSDASKSNKAKSFTLKNKPNEVFELVKDQEEGFYSIHFKTTSKEALTEEEKQKLIKAISDDIPQGSKLSTWGEITKGGISGLNRFKSFGFTESGETRTVKDKSGNNVSIPILIKSPVSDIEAKKADIERRRPLIRAALQKAVNPILVLSDGSKTTTRIETLMANEVLTPEGYVSIDVIKQVISQDETKEYGTGKILAKKGEVLYDAELAALEGAKPAKEERLPAVITVTAEEEALMQQQMDETEDDVVLRKVIEEQANKFEREDWKKVEAWLKANFPNIPVYRVKNILKGANGLQAWGMLKNGAIYVYENAEVGTIYHEVFEGVWKLFADPAEKEAILKEFRERKGEFVDRPTGQKVKFSEATNEQIKEQLAEEFRDYVLYKKIPAKPTEGKPFILRLFADLVNFIKTFFTGNKAQVNTANLFEKIGTGYYKQYVPEAGALAFAKQGLIDIEEAYITADSELRVNMPADTVHDIMQEMTYQTLRGIIEDNESLFNIPTMSKTELYDRLLPAIQKTVLKGRKEAQANLKLKKITEAAANEQINKSVQLWKDVTKNWKDLVDKHQEYLKVYSIEFDENDEIQFKDEDKVKESDYVDARKIDAFKKANSAIKLLFSTLPVMDSNDKPVYSSINGYKLVPASQAFISVMNNVHTSRTPDEMLERLREMAENDPNYRTLYRRLTKVDYSANTDSLDGITEVHDGQLLASFWRTFKKYNPDVKNVFIFEDGAVEVGDSNLATAARQVKSGYVNELIDLVKRKNPYFVYSQDRQAYIGNPAGVAKFGEFKPEGALTEIDKMVAFLKTLGIEFKAEDVAKLPGNVQDTFKDAVKGIKRSIEKTDMIATMGGKVLKIDGRLMSLATIKATIDNPEFDSTFFNVKGERTQTFIGTNPSSDLFDYLSKVESMDDLIGTPYEYLVTDAFSKSYTDAEGNQVPTSVILSKIFNYKSGERKGKTENIMKPGYADGTINRSNGKRKESSKLTFRERLIQEINLNLKGYYYNLVPGDASIQHMTFMGNHINPDELLTTGYNTLNNIFKGYFISELELSRSDRRVAKDRNNEDLRFLKPILDAYDPSLHKEILKDKRSALEVYNSFEKKINAAVQQFIKNESDDLKKTLTDYNIISVSPEGYSVENIGFQETDNVSDEALNRQLNSLTINYVINNIELHKLLYSDPYQYSDELKRIKSFLSPRQAIVHSSEEMNKVFDRVWNKGYEKDDVGYTDMTQEFFRTTTLADVKATSALKDYGIYDETDGSGIIAMKAYRNLRIRAADWTDNEEKQYRYDIAWMKRDKGLPVSSEEQKLLNAGNPEVMSAYTPYKPIVAGDKANGQSFNDVVLDKFALYPLSYRIMKEINNSSNGVKLYEKMQNENIDYVVFQSGRKVGAEGTNDVYNEDGSFNESKFEGIVNVPFNIISVQSEVPSKEEAVVTRGSQVTKLVTMDFMQAGVPIDFMSEEKDFTKRYIAWNALADKTSYNGGDNLYNEIKTNEKLLKALTDFGYKTLLKRMGIEETIVDGKPEFKIKDFSKAAKTLRDEILKREVNDNVSDSLAGFLEGDAVLEATPAYQQVRNILYSIADKNVISTKISGSQKVQIPSTFIESNRLKAEGETGRVFSTENGLKFYKNKDGERVCEIMVGRWFESDMTDEALLEYLNKTPEGQKILQGVAFRIPTQKQNSIDAFVIKKFLPREFGDSVVVPSELVKKVGSDFDIDKLFIYFKNTYLKDGEPKLIPYFGTGEEALSKIRKLVDEGEFTSLDDIKKLSKEQRTELDRIIEEEKSALADTPSGKLLFNLLGQSFENDIVREFLKANSSEKFKDVLTDSIYKKSLENAYIQSMENLISNPLNFENLIKPNSAQPLKDLADKITKKLGLQKLDSASTASLISRDYMTRLRHAFVTGKYAIGIAAVNQTNHSLNQRVPIYIDLDRFDNLSETDKFWITGGTKDRKDAVLKFKDAAFNQIDVNGKSVTTLSMIKNAEKSEEYPDGQNISDIIGMFIDGYVDISKGPWIMELGATPNVASTWLFLVKAGVPIKTVAYFMNQPIIRDYLRMIENEGYSWLFIDEFVKNIKESDKYRTSRSINDVRTLPSATKMYETIGKEKLDQDERINQHFVLNEFLKYATMANQMFQVTQGSNFDTSTFNDPYLIFKKLRQYEKAQNTIISSVDKILDNSFIGDLREKLDNIRGAFAEILKSDHPTVRNVVQKVLDPYVDMPDREFVKIAQKIVNDLFDWAVQVKGGANSQIESILLSDNNAAKEVDKFVKEVKANSKHPLYNNQVINMFTPHFSSRDNSVQNLKLNNKTNKVYDQNQVIYSFEELRKYLNGINSPLYKKIVKLAVLQSGLSNSPISFTSLLPYQDFKEEYNEVLSKLEKITNLEDFADLDVFQRNNWNDDDIVPYRKGKMKFPKEITPEGKTIYTGPPYYSELRWGRGFGDVKKAMTDGKIPQLIRLDSRSKQAGDDVIVFSWEVGTKKDKQEARARGDLSYIQKGLFKKVYNGGQPYIIEDYFGNPQFVYKMINAWGDSHQEEGRYFSANEFYDHARKSKINNGFIPVENEVDDTTVVAFFEGTAGPFSTGKETAPTPAPASGTPSNKDVVNALKKTNTIDKKCNS